VHYVERTLVGKGEVAGRLRGVVSIVYADIGVVVAHVVWLDAVAALVEV
jgi:hypothetical protein